MVDHTYVHRNTTACTYIHVWLWLQHITDARFSETVNGEHNGRPRQKQRPTSKAASENKTELPEAGFEPIATCFFLTWTQTTELLRLPSRLGYKSLARRWNAM